MEQEPHTTNIKFMHNFDALEMSRQKLVKDTNQNLLSKNEQTQEDERTCQRPVSENILDLNECQHGISTQNYCFPAFLSKIGACCVPCYVCCPCVFCSCCPCRSNPLFQQQMQSLGLLQEWGRFERVLQPGLHVINPVSQSIVEINQQTQLIEYRQIGISKDNVQFDLSVVIFYRVVDSLKLAYRLGGHDVKNCLTQIATGTLRNVLGQSTLQGIIEKRQLVTRQFTDELNRQIKFWGLYVEISALKEMKIDKDVQHALEAVTETKRRSEAMIINYKAEVQCGKLIKEISQIINNPTSFQIRYLNMVEQILNNSAQHNVVLVKTSIEEVYQRLTWDKTK